MESPQGAHADERNHSSDFPTPKVLPSEISITAIAILVIKVLKLMMFQLNLLGDAGSTPGVPDPTEDCLFLKSVTNHLDH
jgi:hypothetical protein